jgi:hypothetical protein
MRVSVRDPTVRPAQSGIRLRCPKRHAVQDPAVAHQQTSYDFRPVF